MLPQFETVLITKTFRRMYDSYIEMENEKHSDIVKGYKKEVYSRVIAYLAEKQHLLVEMQQSGFPFDKSQYLLKLSPSEFVWKQEEIRNILNTKLGYAPILPGCINMESDAVKLQLLPNDLIEFLKNTEAEKKLITKEYQAGKEALSEVIRSYGTVKYMLTQFPELRGLCPESSLPPKSWVPNRYMKIVPRSKLKEKCDVDSIARFLGHCAMNGIKP